MTARWLRNASAAAFLCAAFFPSLAVAQQQPPGPTLEFTLNYINGALTQGQLSLNGSNATIENDGDTQTSVGTSTFNLLDIQFITVDGGGNSVNIQCVNGSQCVTYQSTYTGAGVDSGNTISRTFSSVGLYINTTGNALKAQDVVNALWHLINLVKAQNAAQQQQQQEQNQSDPFAKPQ